MLVVTHQDEKIWIYDRATVRPTVQGATFNMRGQLYRGHANASALSSSPVVSALGSESDDPFMYIINHISISVPILDFLIKKIGLMT